MFSWFRFLVVQYNVMSLLTCPKLGFSMLIYNRQKKTLSQDF